MTANDPQTLLVKVAKALNELNLPYLVTGGMSVTLWGRPRFTADIDMVLGIEPYELTALAEQLRRVGDRIYLDENAMREAYASEGEFNVVDGTSGIKVDFWIVRRADPFNASRLARRVSTQIAGETVYFSSPEDLILIKLFWYQRTPAERQLDDVKSIIAVSGANLDRHYLQEWAKKLGVEELLKQILTK
ncbi:MAG: nucleotidyl transferase AbiEii/AbiGii toxin family protein [Patescibacteria group bacterium]